jgi:glutathione S-transferase
MAEMRRSFIFGTGAVEAANSIAKMIAHPWTGDTNRVAASNLKRHIAMKLYWSEACPYSRMTRVTAIEAGLAKELNFIRVDTDPLVQDATLGLISPLAKAPILYVTSRDAFYDSRVICECLNDFGSAALLPSDGPPRWAVLRRQALGMDLMERTIACREELNLRPGQMVRKQWIEVQLDRIAKSLDYLDDHVDGDTFLVGDIAIVCALDFLDTQAAARPWREGRRRLDEWHAEHAKRPSLTMTRFQAP